jgi:hypothetical protein
MSEILDLIHSKKSKHNIRRWLYYTVRKRRRGNEMVIFSFHRLNQNLNWLFDFTLNVRPAYRGSLEES